MEASDAMTLRDFEIETARRSWVVAGPVLDMSAEEPLQKHW
ncbi:MAG: hypothetical protein AAF968_27020 [Pseudomonadota bacterium]